MFFRTRCEDEVLSADSEKKEEQERMEKLLSKYKSSLLDQHSVRGEYLSCSTLFFFSVQKKGYKETVHVLIVRRTVTQFCSV